jgi:hypothetical protein
VEFLVQDSTQVGSLNVCIPCSVHNLLEAGDRPPVIIKMEAGACPWLRVEHKE